MTNTIEEKYLAISHGLQHFFGPGATFIVGLSGGIDSAVVAAIATLVFGSDNVSGIFMPSVYTSETSYRLVKELAVELKISLETVHIDSVQESYRDTLSYCGLEIEYESIPDQNLQARIRAVILMAVSNTCPNSYVLNTGNKSEAMIGYTTLYGDSIGALSSIGDLYKTEVYEMARYINSQRFLTDISIPVEIIDRAPSAELCSNQLDEDDLLPYVVLDAILKHVIDGDPLDSDVKHEDVRFVKELMDKNAFKRYQFPPIILAKR